MISIYCDIPAEIEAHLINSSDWLLDPETIQLGCYAEKNHDTGSEEYYVLYAVKQGIGSDQYLSFGAHFGENAWDYISHPLDVLSRNPLQYCGGSTPIMVAVIRYFLMKEEGKL